MESFNQFLELFKEVWLSGIFGINVSEIIIGLIIFLFFYVLRRLFARFIIRRLSKFVLRSENQIDDAIVNVIEGPLKFLPVVLGFFIASSYVDFSSNDDMQNSYIYKIKGDYFNNGNNFEEAEANYINAYEYVPSYELKTLYCRELVDLYIENDKLKKAKDFFDYVKLSLDDNDNLNFTSKNNLDYIESKLLHLVK